MKKYTFLLFILLVAGYSAVQAQETPAQRKIVEQFGDWYATGKTDSIYTLFNAVMQQALPIEKLPLLFTQITRQIGPINTFVLDKKTAQFSRFTASAQNTGYLLVLMLDSTDKIAGLTSQTKPRSGPPSNFSIVTPAGKLWGSLTLPTNRVGPVPVVLIIAGSGPTDRDGNNPLGVKAGSYRMLADSLQQRGVASLRYDKRFTGESTAFTQRPDALLLDDYIQDAVLLIDTLRKDRRFSGVVVLGHSEGSLIGMLAAQRGGAKAFISLAGAGEPIDRILVRQLSVTSPATGMEAAKLLDSLKKGLPPTGDYPALAATLPPALYPYLRSWMQYDPVLELKKLSLPVSIVQGTTDLQVGLDQALRLKKGLPKATLVSITGMNHALKTAPSDRKANLDTYSNPALPLHPDLVPQLMRFITPVFPARSK